MMPHAVIIPNIVHQWNFKYSLYTVIMKIEIFFFPYNILLLLTTKYDKEK